jgi:putative ABC transport system permease protein
MFSLTYLGRELRHRKRQSVLMALGLALGVGLVMTVNAAASATADAQGRVLGALYGVGTDVTVTTVPVPGENTTKNHKVESDPTSHPHMDFLESDALGLIDGSSVTSIARLHGVKAATGVLRLVDTKVNGGGTSKGQQDGSGTSSSGHGSGNPRQEPAHRGQGSPAPGKGTPHQKLAAPPSATQNQIIVDGVDPAHTRPGPLSDGTIVSGRLLRTADRTSDVAVLDADYAAAHDLSVGSTIVLAGTRFPVVGIMKPAQSGDAPDVYVPLARAQALAGAAHKVNTVYVTATSARQVPAVRDEISHLLPLADVNTSETLAREVTGSLADAATLADDLGRWLVIAVLVTAFAVACLLTITSVSRRVREFGTLKALGWSTRRITRQVMAESVTTGGAGALLGVGIGFAGVYLISRLAPTLHASVAASPGSPVRHGTTIQVGPSGSPKVTHPLDADALHTVSIHFHPTVSLAVMALAVALAIAGALLAGLLGAWRAARLQPVQALARVE